MRRLTVKKYTKLPVRLIGWILNFDGEWYSAIKVTIDTPHHWFKLTVISYIVAAYTYETP